MNNLFSVPIHIYCGSDELVIRVHSHCVLFLIEGIVGIVYEAKAISSSSSLPFGVRASLYLREKKATLLSHCYLSSAAAALTMVA